MEKVSCPHCFKGSLSSFAPQIPFSTWHFVPVCICINLKNRTDRFKHCQYEFHRIGLCQKIHYIFVEKPSINSDQAGTIGCWTSHQKASKIISENYQFGLVLEDDVLFDSNNDNVIQGAKKIQDTLKKWIDHKTKWDVLFLGCWQFWIRPNFSIGDKKFSIKKCHARCFHSYMISNRFASKLADTDFEDQFLGSPNWIKNHFPGFGVDTWSAYTNKNSYCLFPMIAYQSPSPSSNDRKINKLFINWALSDPDNMKMNQYVVLIVSVFFHIFLCFFSSSYRKQMTM